MQSLTICPNNYVVTVAMSLEPS